MLLTGSRPTVSEFESATGWKLTERGACHGSVCIPLPPNAVSNGTVDVAATAAAMAMPVAVHPDGTTIDDAELVALGPSTGSGAVLPSVECPDVELSDFDGNPFHLSSLRGTKFVLVAWAPY